MTKQHNYTPVQFTYQAPPIGELIVYGCGCNYLKNAKGEVYWSRCEQHEEAAP